MHSRLRIKSLVFFLHLSRDYDGPGQIIDEGKIIPDGKSAPFAFWLETMRPYSVQNLDTMPIDLIRVELKTPTR